MNISMLGLGGRSPVGGTYVLDVKGDEVFYQGGQFLPEEFSCKKTKARVKKDFKRLLQEMDSDQIKAYKVINTQMGDDEKRVYVEFKFSDSDLSCGHYTGWKHIKFFSPSEAEDFKRYVDLMIHC